MEWTTESLGNGWKSFFNLKNGKKSRKTVSRSIKDQDTRDGEYATAVLAATFAIHSLEEAKSSQNKNEKRKDSFRKGLLQPHSNEVTRRPSYNNTKIAGETSMRKPKLQDREALETLHPSRTPSRSFSFRLTPAHDRVERHEKLKSILAWANEKKMKAKNKIERTKNGGH